MNYIGSKHKLSDFIKDTIYQIVGNDLDEMTFCDLFAGTGSVAKNFKAEVKKIICSDIEYYSYVLIRNSIGNTKKLKGELNLIKKLNHLEGIEGFIFKHYCLNENSERQYFSIENGKKIDAIRQQIETWKLQKQINTDTYYFLLASLLESADKVANTASVYGAYLKHLKKTAQKPLHLQAISFEVTAQKNEVYHADSNALIQTITGDILYLDPPYNARQYGANYHLLNTIALYDDFKPKGKTGLRNYAKSDYCSKQSVLIAFENLIYNAKFKYIFLSYNNEGLMPAENIKAIMEKYGTYQVFTKKYQRFKADKTENRNHKADETLEFLHVLIKK